MQAKGKTVYFSASTAKTLITDGPKAAYDSHYLLGGIQREKGPALRKGILIDRLVFEKGPEVIELPYDSWRTNAAKKDREEIEKTYAIAALPHEIIEAAGIAACARAEIADLIGHPLDPKHAQRKIVWQESGVDCKAILDYHEPYSQLIIDLKTCGNLTEEKARADAFRWRYDIQAGAFAEAADADPETWTGLEFQVVFLFVDSKTGESMWIPCTDAVMACGTHEWRRARDIWRNCLETNNFPEKV